MKRFAVSFGVGLVLLLFGSAIWRGPVRFGGSVSAQPQGTAVGDPLFALSERFEAVASRVVPAVVAVEALKPAGTGSGPKGKPVEEAGSGVIIRVENRPGYVVITNYHVVGQAPPQQITIHAADNRILRPSQVLADPETDIALLILDNVDKLPTASLGNSDHAKVGRWVLAIGSPFGLNQSVTHGIISARDRGQVSLGSAIRIKEFLQTDAAINPGSSGGPLVDLNGDVIGINTAIASHNGSNSGVAFSIPINLVKRVMNQLLNQGAVQRGYLGLQLSPGFDAHDAAKLGLDRVQGALVERVYPDTPAAAAGLRGNDVILAVEGITIRNEHHLINLISNLPPGQRIRLQLWRDRSTITVEATVADWASAARRQKAE
ncbi:MAG: trypsin-like peptidase domain-containing protein [Gemmataceae bacterium]|nr:trypsin-like peptidase domain-containing protein [Gemmataceae bacterium]